MNEKEYWRINEHNIEQHEIDINVPSCETVCDWMSTYVTHDLLNRLNP